MKRRTNSIQLCAAAATSAILAIVIGCNSNGNPQPQPEANLDTTQNNRLLVRMALAENVYNGIATERALYPGDFLPGTASLSELGVRRVENLVHAYRGASGHMTIIRGNEPQDLYDARVAAVRQQFADAGVEAVTVTGGDRIDARGISSGQAIVSFERMMSEYLAKPQGGAAGAAPAGAAMPGTYQPSPGIGDRTGN